MAEADKAKSGWWWPINSRKAHYINMPERRSLCGRWMYMGDGTILENDKHNSSDNCALCKKRAKM